MRDFRRLLQYLRPYWASFALALAAMLVNGVFEGAIGALIVPIFDQLKRSALGGEAAATTVNTTLFGLQNYIPAQGAGAWRTIALLLVGFTLCKGVAEYFSTYLMAKVGQSAVKQMRQELYAHLLQQSSRFYEGHRTNFLVSRLVNSAAAIEIAVTATARDVLREGIALIVFLSAAFWYSWRLTLGALLIGPVVGLLTARFSKAIRGFARESFEGSKLLTDTAQETLANHAIVKAYRAEERERARFNRVTDLIANANLRTAAIAGLSPATIELVGVIAIAILLFFAQREIALGRLADSQFFAALIFIFRSYDPIRRISRQVNVLDQALVAARDIWEVMDENAETPEKPNARPLSPLKHGLELKNVSFYYSNEDRMILRDVNLAIPAGHLVALVGASGGGKSTLTKLIPRFQDPTEGSVLWDGADTRDATLESLRGHIALVTQETVLFNDTVRYNITYGRPDATQAEIEHAAQVAFADEFIKDLPQGYDTLIGERGIFLSGGQRQRLAIARAVLANAPVLILDEATSALDAESEQLVQRALNNLVRDRTTLVIAHRLSTVRRANNIVVMDKGRVAESGTHEQLLERGGIYRRLYELQFAEEEMGSGQQVAGSRQQS
jgi:subfamily B ATP-binding cassette protein MsbA